jgi:hypothetical protein
MRQRRNVALVVALIATLVICVGPVQAKPTRITFSAHEELVDGADGTTTSHGGMTFIRNATLTYRDTAANPMDIGTNYTTFNANWDANGNGPIWGKNRLVTDEGGVWEGSWNGTASAFGADFHGHAEDRGEGMYKGLVAKITLHSDPTGIAVGWEILKRGGLK